MSIATTPDRVRQQVAVMGEHAGDPGPDVVSVAAERDVGDADPRHRGDAGRLPTV